MTETFSVSIHGNLVDLKAAGTGRVAAVFDHSFYVVMGGAWVCVGTESLPMGPLNMRTNWRPGGMRIQLQDKFMFNLGGAETWTPPPPKPWNTGTLARGLAALQSAARHRLPAEGLGGFVLETPAGDLAAHADPFIRLLTEDPLSADAPAWISRLVGLGPGLTPSGDDFLGGMLIALRLLEQREVLSRFSEMVLEAARLGTHDISRAHLKAAAAGAGSEALHNVVNQVLCGETADLTEIDRIGHCSGWDALAGAVRLLRAGCRPVPEDPVPASAARR